MLLCDQKLWGSQLELEFNECIQTTWNEKMWMKPCLWSSPQQYGYPPDRRSASSSVPPQTITPQSLQGKTVGVNSRTHRITQSAPFQLQ